MELTCSCGSTAFGFDLRPEGPAFHCRNCGSEIAFTANCVVDGRAADSLIAESGCTPPRGMDG